MSDFRPRSRSACSVAWFQVYCRHCGCQKNGHAAYGCGNWSPRLRQTICTVHGIKSTSDGKYTLCDGTRESPR